jgi:hypothetical protein
MKRRSIETFKMLMQAVDFLKRSVGLFPKSSAAAEVLKALVNGVAKLAETAAASKSEASAMREASNIRAAARTRLHDLIVRASLISEALRTEKVGRPAKKTDHEWISVGRGFVTSAEPLKSEFLKHGLALEEVLEAVEALETAIVNYTNAKAARSAAIAEWNSAMAEAMVPLAGLDALVANFLANDPGALASYELVRTVVHTRGRAAKSKATTEGAPETPTTPASSSAATAA